MHTVRKISSIFSKNIHFGKNPFILMGVRSQLIRIIGSSTVSTSLFLKIVFRIMRRYEVGKYTWESGRDLSKRLSVTLRTRDHLKYWYQCEAKHLYVSIDGESCIDCVEIERAKSWADSSEDFPLRKITKEESGRHYSLPQVAGIMTSIKKQNNKKRGQWQQKEQREERSIKTDEAKRINYEHFDSGDHNFAGNQRYNFDTSADENWRQERRAYMRDSIAETRLYKERTDLEAGWHSHDNQPLLPPNPEFSFQPGFDTFHEKDSRENEKDWKGKNKQTNHYVKRKNRKK